LTDRQRNQHIADIVSVAAGGLSVHVSRWPHLPGRPPQVMWFQSNHYSYLPPEVARRFAQALLKAADAAERGVEERPGH